MSHVEGCVWFVSFQREPGVPKPNGGGVVMQRNLCGRMISFFVCLSRRDAFRSEYIM